MNVPRYVRVIAGLVLFAAGYYFSLSVEDLLEALGCVLAMAFGFALVLLYLPPDVGNSRSW
jgi:hypothetical protein